METALTRLIDQYLSGELSPEDGAVFEQRMEQNERLRQEVEMQRDIQEAAKRAAQRTEILKVRKAYHLKKLLKYGFIGLSVLTVALLVMYYYQGTTDSESETFEVDEERSEQLDAFMQIEDLETQYFGISEEGALVMSEGGVLLSVPKHAFLLNGKAYDGAVIVQFQEAMDASDIMKAGLSTMSGDRLLETQGMFGVAGFTENGKPLEFNPKVGVYVQVPVDEYKEGMQLFTGVKDGNGNIDWQNPRPLAKLPVPVDMSELDFYPEQYEPYLNSIQWKTDKQSRDSLYLTYNCPPFSEIMPEADSVIAIIPVNRKLTPEESYYIYMEDRPIENPMTQFEAEVLMGWYDGPNYERDFKRYERSFDFPFGLCNCELSPYVQPSSVLAFWNKKFNNTNLATREFEQRMRAVHGTCNEAVLKKYTSQLKKSLSEIDKEVVAMGYSQFEAFAAENLAPVNPGNPHLDRLAKFYQQGIEKLRYRADKWREKEQNRQEKWDKETGHAREKERTRTAEREVDVLVEEFKFNMGDVKRQIGPSLGFTLKHGGGTIVNIDKYVWDATVARETTTITDPITGKQAVITYNDFTFEVDNSEKYIKLFAYVLPHELNSYHRLEGKKGKFEFPLNNAILYDMAVVGVKEDGYDYFQKKNFRMGDLGTLELAHISEEKMKASLEQLNQQRNNSPIRISDEVKWLTRERADYKEQKMRKAMAEFRNEVAWRLFPCSFETPVQRAECTQ